MGGRVFFIGLAVAVGLGLGLRLAVIFSPLGEIDGDEAVVGLMARHIAFLGEQPVFYWGQPYLGSLEAFSAAPLFHVFDSSTPMLKLVPATYSLGFLVLAAILSRRISGVSAGLATAAYLAMPPAMWAVWSSKARGGYAEVLFLGQALLLATLELARSPNRRLAFLWGILAGLALWTHLLAVVYVVPALVYLLLARRRAWSVAQVGVGAAGAVVGMTPLLLENLSDGFQTFTALLEQPEFTVDPGAQFFRFFRVGIPVLVGLGQPTTSDVMFDLDWLHRPAGHWSVAALSVLVVAAAVAVHLPALKRLIAHGVDRGCETVEPALLVLVALIVPPVVSLTRFGFFVSEPRYALPLYATLPLLIGAVWQLPFKRVLPWAIVCGLLGLNLWSLATTDPRLWRSEESPDSTATTRAELVKFLVAEDRHQMYTDYWIGYPIMFETRETVLAYVISGGFNRYVPPADNVQRTPNPAWVFTPGMEAERLFLDELAAVGGQARISDVSVYRVYTDVQPLAALRPGNPNSTVPIAGPEDVSTAAM